MAINPLEYAILALDSYNQGYGPYVNHGETTIGSVAKILESDISSDSDEVNANFYAAAYLNGGNIVISYRGTDNPVSDSVGWSGGAGFQTAQARLAAEFYYQVKAAYPGATRALLIN